MPSEWMIHFGFRFRIRGIRTTPASDKAMQKLRKRREQSRHHALYKCTETVQKSVPSLLLNSAWGLTGIGVRIRALCIACDYGHYKGLNN